MDLAHYGFVSTYSGLNFVIAVEELEKAKPRAKKHTRCTGKSLFG